MALLTSIQHYWKLDESSGNAADSVGSDTLVNTNTATYTGGKINNGVTLVKASSQQLKKSNPSTALPTSFTMSGWIKPTGTMAADDENTIFSLGYFPSVGNLFTLERYLTGGTYYIFVGVAGSFGTIAHTLTSDVWAFIAITYTGGTFEVFINGSSIGTISKTWSPTGTANDAIVIGAEALNTRYWNGMIDEVGMWSRVLTGAEITELYNGGAGLTYPFVAPSSKGNFFALM